MFDSVSDSSLYYYSLLGFGVLCFFISVWVFKLHEDVLNNTEKLPRSLLFGMPIAVIDLFWCIPHAKPLLSESMHVYLIPTAIVCSFLTYFLLDYVFARALGGFFILLAYYFLHESFTFHTPVLPLFSFFCYLMGIAGLFFCGKPYLFRDLIRKASKHKNTRYATSGAIAFFAILSIVLGFQHLV